MDFLLCPGDALSDETFQEEGIAPAAWRAGSVLSCQQQGEANERERQGGCSLGGVQEEQDMPVLPECQKGVLREPEESRGNSLQYSRHLRGVQLKKQVQGEEPCCQSFYFNLTLPGSSPVTLN